MIGVAPRRPAARPTERLRQPGFELLLRPGVAWRETPAGRGSLLYLCLYDDEIDERAAEFARVLARDAGDAAAALELTDAVVIADASGSVEVWRGAACTFPLYAQADAGRLQLATLLPLEDGGSLSRAGLLAAMAAVTLPGSHELNAVTDTPRADWRRLRRGARSRCTDGVVAGEWPVYPAGSAAAAPELQTPEAIAAAVRAALAAYRHSQRQVHRSVLELSGGYDSTLAAATALGPDHHMAGISVEFPYYEFRLEAPVQQAVAAALGISRTILDGTDLFPYSPWERPPRFDEPAAFVTGIRHAGRVASHAAKRGAERLYTGHGGDHLFAVDLTAPESMAARLDRRAFTPQARRALAPRLAAIAGSPWRQRATGCFLYDARQDIWVKESFGVTLRTPFTDLALFRAGLAWSRLNACRRRRPDKTVLDRAAGDLLPAAVTGRQGKVAYDGVWMRAYAAHHDHIAGILERTAPALEGIGLRPGWLLAQARALADWRPGAERELLGAYAIGSWLVCRGLERAPDLLGPGPLTRG